MTQQPVMYSAEDFHCKFPAVNVSVETWYYWLGKWRNSKPPKLIRNIHWMYAPGVTCARMVYLPRPVLRLILTDATASYFGSQFDGVYGNSIRIYIENPANSEPSIDTPL